MDETSFRMDVEGAVATLCLTRGASGNKLLASELPGLGKTIREAGTRTDVKLVLIRGEGEHFCLGRQPDGPPAAPPTAMGIRTRVAEPILGLYADVRATPVPVIAIVQGDAKGFGCALVGQCDLAIAADSATFSMPEMDHQLPPTLAISAVLGKVPPKRLLHLIYMRNTISAAEALSLGLLSEVVPRAELDAAVDETLAKLTDRNRNALVAVKEYMASAPYIDPASAARLAANMLSTVFSSPKEE